MVIRRILCSAALSLTLIGCAVGGQKTPQPSSTPTATQAPSATPTVIPSLTPTLTPTPTPKSQVETADQLLWEGNYDQALDEYELVLKTNPDAETLASALYGIGRIKYDTGDYSAAITSMQQLADQHPDAAVVPEAYYWLGQSYQAIKRDADAADAYAKFIDLRPNTVDAYLQELRGDALSAAGNHTTAIEAYTAASAAPQLGDNTATEVKIGQEYLNSGDLAKALEQFDKIYTTSKNDYTRADADLFAGEAYLQENNLKAATDRFMDAVVNFPKAYSAYASLVQIVQSQVPVSDLYRGIVDYYAGEHQAGQAALSRYILSGQDKDGTALYYKALSQTDTEEYEGAISTWDLLIQNFPDNPNWADAWEEKASIQWADLDKFDDAAQTLLDFVAKNPTDKNASAYLYEAGRIFERGNDLDRAAATWDRLLTEYPAADETFRGLFFAGVARFRLGKFDDAKTNFQRAFLLTTDLEDQAAAQLWVGKTRLAQSDQAGAQSAWRQAALIDPTGYYSVRAGDLLASRAPFTPAQTLDLGVDLGREKADAEKWLRKTFDLPDQTDLSGPGSLASDPRFIRGTEFWKLGLNSQARAEFEDLRLSLKSDPAGLYRLIGYLYDLGLYRSVIMGSRQILTLANLDDASSLNAPVYFNHLRFGAYYRDLVLPVSQQEKVDPLLVFSLMRQESLFEGFVQSGAGARGLMQIVPATGEGIAANLAWPANFTDDDLYRPVVSTRLGIHYLAQQLDYFQGDIYASLAAYNGGPGNASSWQALSGSDPDLFLETIRIQETRDYIMRIYEIYTIYRQFYNRAQ